MFSADEKSFDLCALGVSAVNFPFLFTIQVSCNGIVFEPVKEELMAFKINHLHLKTPDPRKTVDWYIKYIGAKIVSERKTPSGRTTFRLNLHGVELNVTDFLEEQKLSQFYGLEHVAIDTDNFAGEVAKIKADGVKILEERVLPDGRKVCFFEGPEGVRLEFLEMR
jgi:catechol 2,3-dioxygenase-like lactoylglutathione lyase family enzyme